MSRPRNRREQRKNRKACSPDELKRENRELRRLVLVLAERVYLMSQHLTLIAERGTRTDRLRKTR